MGISSLGIVKEDFEQSAFADLSRTVFRTPMTKTTSNTSGAVTFTAGTPENIYAIFTKRTKRFDYSKEGLVEMGDAFMQIKQDQTLNKEDLIAVDSETYRVNEILLRVPGGSNFFKSVTLFKI
jgi:hypothetical protein